MFSNVCRQGFALSVGCCLAAATAVGYTQSTAPAAPQKTTESAPLPPAQKIIDRHIEAVGGKEALKSHSSVNLKGAITIPANGMSGTIEVFAARPNKMLAKTTLAGIGDIMEGYDGTVAWSISPMTGPMLATGEELAQKSFDANFDGALGIASRYDAMKTVEKTTFQGRPVYKIALTRKIGGTDDIEFYDVETGLKAGGMMERKNPMGTISVTSSVSDYKKFGNLLQPTVMKQSTSGVEIVTTFTTIDYDKVDPSVFELPAQIKALVK
jgi:hypothetical protein